MIADKYQQLLNHCCGKAPRPFVKPQPLTGIDKHERELDRIEVEYQQKFGGKQEV